MKHYLLFLILISAAGNIFCMSFPAETYFRTSQEGFNRRYYFLIKDKCLWVKPVEGNTNEPSIWTPVTSFKNRIRWSYPFQKIEQLSVDGSQLEIVYQNRIYTCNNGQDHYTNWIWDHHWGFPFNLGAGLNLPSEYKAWSISFSDPDFHKYQTDGNGNKFKVFVGSAYLLSKDGTSIHLADPWTPADWGYQIGTPERGKLVLKNLSVSGSTVFVISENGEMYTKYIDFDVMGANPSLSYTYEKIPAYEGIFDREHARKIPLEDWKHQPNIKGRITGKITVLSTGPGENSRLLRVEGLDNYGNYGFYEKMIEDSEWIFKAVPGQIDENSIITNMNPVTEASKEMAFTGCFQDYKIRLNRFQFWESTSDLEVSILPNLRFRLILHTVFTFRMNTCETPGLNGVPIVYSGAIEIPEETRNNPDPKIQEFLCQFLSENGKIKTFTKINCKAVAERIEIRKNIRPDNPGFDWILKNQSFVCKVH